MDIEDVITSMNGYFKESTIADFVYLSKLFHEPRYQLLIRKALDIESRLLISAAKNGDLYQDVMRWAAEKGVAKRSTLSDRKHYLMGIGIISEKTSDRTGKRGRPKKLLFMTDENVKRFEELFSTSPAQ